MVTLMWAVDDEYPERLQVAVIAYVPTAQPLPRGETTIWLVDGATPGIVQLLLQVPGVAEKLHTAPPRPFRINVRPPDWVPFDGT